MDIDSEEEVEYLFDAGALGSQESLFSESESTRQQERSQSGDVASPSSSAPARYETARASRIPHPQRADSTSRPDSRRVPPAPHHVIDLEAYHHGPFRGALARVVEASRRQQRTNESTAGIVGATANHIPGTSRTSNANPLRSTNAEVSLVPRSLLPL